MALSKKKFRITEVVTHDRPHLDELSALHALEQAGGEMYSGLSRAKITVFDPAIHGVGTEEEWEERGILFLGVRGGRFDDHPHDKFQDECCLTLVMQHLGLSCDPAWKWLAKEVLTEDRKGTSAKLHLALCIKSLGRSHDAREMCRIVFPILEALLQQQRSFSQAVRIVGEGKRFEIFNGHSNKKLLLVVVDGSDNEDIARAARWEGGLDAAAVVHRNSRGHVYISTSNRVGFCNLDWLAGRLRAMESNMGSKPHHELCELGGDGLDSNWYHQRDARAIFAGTPTAVNADTTTLHLDKIVEAVKAFMAGTRMRNNNPQAVGHEKRQTVRS